ncbi:MAG: Gfo/Idh/MocA family oxidoreductase [Bacteroidales bacterium]
METDRRDFIKTFGMLAGSGLAVAGMPWMNELMAQDPQKPIKLGIIGVGSRGLYHLEILQMIPGATIVAYCDNYEPHYTRTKEMLGAGARGYYDYKVMLEQEEMDAVIIATPLHEHTRITIDALNAGLHVFCEKSMAQTYEECNAMVEAHLQNDRILHIGHQRLFNIRYQQALKDINNGLIGKITQIRAYWHRNNDWRRKVPSPELERKINWRLYDEYSMGLMTELASHQIQVANWFLKEKPECVWGTGSINHWHDGREVYDNVNLVYKYPGGTHLVYDSMTSNKKYGLEEQILGPLGTLELEAGLKFQEFPKPAPGLLQLINHIEKKIFDVVPIGGPSWVPDDPSEDTGAYIIDEVMKSDGSIMQMEAFVANVRANRVEKWITKEGFYASIATIMGYEAMKKNEVVFWPENLVI